jgi:hypothetical protein
MRSDVAAAVRCVCREEAALITGKTMDVDGSRGTGSVKLPRATAIA